MPIDQVARVVLEIVDDDGRARPDAVGLADIDAVFVRDVYVYASRWCLNMPIIAATLLDLVAVIATDAGGGE